MSYTSEDVEASLIREAYSRGLGPAIAYFALGVLIYFYQFSTDKFHLAFEVLSLAICAVSLVRMPVAFLGARGRIDLNRHLPILKLTTTLQALLWGGIFGLATYDVRLGSIQSMVSFILSAGLISATPTSLIALPRIQSLFLICTSLVPALVYAFRFTREEYSTDLLVLPIMHFIYFFYFRSMSRKLRADLVLIFEQQGRIRSDLAAAKDIQRSLLPEIFHRFGDTELNILYRPCEELSGDFFEIHKQGSHVLFYLADVTSHGTASAQVTYLLKGIFKNIVAHLDNDIAVAALTKKMAMDYVNYKLNYSVSLFVAHYDLATGVLEYVASSFPSPIKVARGDFEVLATPTNSIIDSAFADEMTEFAKSTVTILPGETFFAFTDGSYEFNERTSGREYGYKRFAKMLSATRNDHWEEAIVKNLEAANLPGAFQDDVTILRLDRKAAA